jgi:hypothetical protein
MRAITRRHPNSPARTLSPCMPTSDGNGKPRGGDEEKRKQVKQSSGDRRQQADDNGAFGAASVGKMTRPNTRDQRGCELTAGDKPDHKRAQAETLMHVQRQHWQRDANNEKSDEDRAHNRQQRRYRLLGRGRRIQAARVRDDFAGMSYEKATGR